MEKIRLGDQSGIREINDIGLESELEGGVHLDRLPIGSALEVKIGNHAYIIEKNDDGYYMYGSHEFFPEPTKIEIRGSTMGGKAIRRNFIGRGMMLEFIHPKYGETTTSWIEDVKEIKMPREETPTSGDHKK